MKIGYFCNSTNWNNKPFNEILEQIRDIATYCDQNKWDSIWFTEHHFSHEGMETCPNPLMMSADIAARTKNIRIGNLELQISDNCVKISNLEQIV